jgi:hypothetical protein
MVHSSSARKQIGHSAHHKEWESHIDTQSRKPASDIQLNSAAASLDAPGGLVSVSHATVLDAQNMTGALIIIED